MSLGSANLRLESAGCLWGNVWRAFTGFPHRFLRSKANLASELWWDEETGAVPFRSSPFLRLLHMALVPLPQPFDLAGEIGRQLGQTMCWAVIVCVSWRHFSRICWQNFFSICKHLEFVSIAKTIKMKIWIYCSIFAIIFQWQINCHFVLLSSTSEGCHIVNWATSLVDLVQ